MKSERYVERTGIERERERETQREHVRKWANVER